MPYANEPKGVKALDVYSGEVYNLEELEDRFKVLDLLCIREVAISDKDVEEDGFFFEVLDVFAEAWVEGNAANGHNDWYFLNTEYARQRRLEKNSRKTAGTVVRKWR